MTNEELRHWVRIRMADLRRRTSLSNQDFADKAGVSLRHVYKLEDGESSPTVEMLSGLVRAYGSDLAQFFEPLRAVPGRPDLTHWHDLLEIILACGEETLVTTVRENLAALADKAEDLKRRRLKKQKNLQKPKPRPNGQSSKHHPKAPN